MYSAETFAKELRATITLNEAGKPRRMSKLEAIAKRQTIKAIGGDQRAAEFLIKTIAPREVEQIDNLSPLLREMRAIHEMQSLADQNRDRAADVSNQVDDAEK